MDNPTLKLEKRTAVGGGKAKRLLEQGLVPAVVYGRGFGSAAAQVKRSELKKFLKTNGKNTVFKTEFAHEHDLSMIIKNIQYDPVNKEIIHLDFQKIDSQETVQMHIPVRVSGEKHIQRPAIQSASAEFHSSGVPRRQYSEICRG